MRHTERQTQRDRRRDRDTVRRGRRQTQDRNREKAEHMDTGGQTRQTDSMEAAGRQTDSMQTYSMQVGDRQTGGMQVGDRQTGGMQVGDRQTGGMQVGDRQAGGMQVGDRQAGGMQVGDRQTGGMQVGDRHTAVILDCAGSDRDILVSVPPSWPENSRVILHKYFQSRRKSCGGECDVIRVNEQTYRVTFLQTADKERVLRRASAVIEFNNQKLDIVVGNEHQSVTANGDGACPPKPTQRTEESKVRRDDGEPSKRTGEPRGFFRNNPHRDAPREIFTKVSVTINADLFSEELIRGIPEKFPSLRVTKRSHLGIEEVTGTFNDIDTFHKYLCERVPEAERTPARLRGVNATLPTSLYQYLSEIYPEELGRITSECKVELERIDEPADCTRINIMSRQSDSHPERARQAITEVIQKITSDWEQTIARPRLPKIPPDFTQHVRKSFPKTLPIVHGDTVILRGPADEISQARSVIEADVNSARVPKPVTINSSMAADVTVSKRHLEILKRFRAREIREIEQKYNVTMEEEVAGPKEVCVTFRSAGGHPDLGAHASQIFLCLLQAAITEAGGAQPEGTEAGGPQPEGTEAGGPQPEGTEAGGPQPEGTEAGGPQPEGTEVRAGYSRQETPTASSKRILNDDRNSSWPSRGSHLGDGATGEEPTDSGDLTQNKKAEICPICLDNFTEREVLPKCNHEFCRACLQTCMKIKPVCPVCNVAYGVVTGNQPQGTMRESVVARSLPGYRCNTIQITYSIPDGTQGPDHPNPGRPFRGTYRVAYLPDDQEGREVLRLLQKAFKQKLIFTIGESRSTGKSDCVTWNDIHHKTNTNGGPSSFGYPDREYLKRVREELKAKGIE